MKTNVEKTELLTIALDPVIAIKCGDDQNRADGILYFLQRGVNNLSATSSQPSLFFAERCKQPKGGSHA